MIRRLRALGRILEFARCDPATASSGGSLDHKPCRIGFAIIVQLNQSLQGTGGTLVAFSQISSNSMRRVTLCPQTRPANGHGRHDEKGTGFGR